MSDESEEYSDDLVNLESSSESNTDFYQSFEELFHLCKKYDNKRSRYNILSRYQVCNFSKFEFKFKNCYESIDFNSTYSNSNTKQKFFDIFFNFVKKGIGIAQIVGSSGSGKTAICLRIAKTFQGVVLYLDTSGSTDPINSPFTSKFIPLRLYSYDELLLVLDDFENRLSENRFLSDNLTIKARSIEMLILDSLWCVEQLDKFQQQSFLFNLSKVLRRISWKYNICIVVCVNFNNKLVKSAENKERDSETGVGLDLRKNLYKKWNCNCYVRFLLTYKTLNYKFINLNNQGPKYPLVYRILQIISGSSNKKFKFNIEHDNIVLEDITS